MAKKKKENVASEKLVTKESILDFEALSEPDAYGEDDKLKYKANVILTDADADRIEKIAVKMAKEAFGDLKKEDMDGWVIKEGNAKFFSRKESPEKYDHLKDKRWIQPTRLEKLGRPDLFYIDWTDKSKIKIKDDDEITEKFYRGAKVLCSFTMSTFNVAGKKGVTAYLNAVTFVRDGERLSSSGTEFDAPIAELEPDVGDEVDAEIGANL